MTDFMPTTSARESINLNLWERAIAPRLKQLTQSEERNLSDNDVFAWLLQQAGFLKRGEIEKAEISVIIALFMDQADDYLREGRFQLRELMKTLLILCSAPSARARDRSPPRSTTLPTVATSSKSCFATVLPSSTFSTT